MAVPGSHFYSVHILENEFSFLLFQGQTVLFSFPLRTEDHLSSSVPREQLLSQG